MDGPLNVLLVIFDITKDTESSSNMSGRGWAGMVCVAKVGIVTWVLVNALGIIGCVAVAYSGAQMVIEMTKLWIEACSDCAATFYLGHK